MFCTLSFSFFFLWPRSSANIHFHETLSFEASSILFNFSASSLFRTSHDRLTEFHPNEGRSSKFAFRFPPFSRFRFDLPLTERYAPYVTHGAPPFLFGLPPPINSPACLSSYEDFLHSPNACSVFDCNCPVHLCSR